jgi:hypothetical protein
MALGDKVSFRLYKDTRPHHLETATLQKGLVLTLNEKELVEEGVGFGVPAAIFPDKTYFSGSSSLEIKEKGLTEAVIKNFHLDMISRKSLWKALVNDRLYKLLTGSFVRAYRNSPNSRSVIFPLIKLRNKFGIRTMFTRVESRGVVKVTYTIKRRKMNIRADFSALDKRCLRVLLLNEQGSTFFNRFFDANSLSLSGDKIGPWDLIKADWGCLSDSHNTLSFCLRNVPNSRLFRGREHVPGRLAWAGMTYEVSPDLGHFNYQLRIGVPKPTQKILRTIS